MREVRLDHLLAGLPAGLPVPLACWLLSRVARATAPSGGQLAPALVHVRLDGSVRVAPAEAELGFEDRSPEVIRGAEADARSVVFSLGALLVTCITGRSAFARGSDLETRIAVTQEEIAPLTGRAARATPELDAIVFRALEKSPDARFREAEELAAQLDAFLERELHEVDSSDLLDAIRASSVGVPVPRRPTPGPQALRPAAPLPPRSGVVLPTPPPVDARRAAPPPVDARRAAPPPASRPAPPVDDGPDYARADLDLGAAPARRSTPNRPRLDLEVVRLHDPRGRDAGAGITEAAVTFAKGASPPGASRPSSSRPGASAGRPVIDIDERALARERARPATLASEEAPPPPGPNWILRIGALLVALLATAIAYQFLLRPLLRE